MAGSGVDLNLNLRTDVAPLQLLKELVLSPLIYIRLLGILCSIVVFSCVADQVQSDYPGIDRQVCYFYADSLISDVQNIKENACNFTITIGVIAFLLSLAFLLKDILYVVIDYSDNIVIKKVIVLVDAATNGLWAVMWLAVAIFMADRLRNSLDDLNILIESGVADSGVRNCEWTAVVFSFFCVLIWVAIMVMNIILFVRIWKGTDISTRTQEFQLLPSSPEALREEEYQDDEEEAGNDEGEAGDDEREAGNDGREAEDDEGEARNDEGEAGDDKGEAEDDEREAGGDEGEVGDEQQQDTPPE